MSTNDDPDIEVIRGRRLTEALIAWHCPDCQRQHLADRGGLQYRPCDRTRQIVLLVPPVHRPFAVEATP